MKVICKVTSDDIPSFLSEMRYLFLAVPRIGETVVLEWEENVDHEYVVEGVKHLHDEHFVILHVREIKTSSPGARQRYPDLIP
jgi:hypothetical protein